METPSRLFAVPRNTKSMPLILTLDVTVNPATGGTPSTNVSSSVSKSRYSQIIKNNAERFSSINEILDYCINNNTHPELIGNPFRIAHE